MLETIDRRLRVLRSRLVGCLLLVALVTGACGGDEAASEPGTPTVVATVAPTSTPLPPPHQSNPFRGTASVSDAAGDVAGSAAVPPGIDLTGARIVSSVGNLVLIWYTTEKAETAIADGSTAAWTFELANGDQPAYDVTFRVAGKEWDILVVDRETGEETKHRIGSIYRDRLDVPYPAMKLEKLQPTFTWTARSHYTDATGATWTDLVPNDGARLTYPN